MKAKVTKVIDGDSFKTAKDVTVRLAYVDTPKEGYSGFEAAKNKLERLVLNKEVEIEEIDEDSWGRPTYDVKINDESVNEKMRGHL